MFYYGKQSPVIERDPEIQKLEQIIDNKIQKIINQTTPTQPKSAEIRFVSFEEALKELIFLKNSSGV